MKKLLIAAFVLTTAVSVFAQGSVLWASRYSGTGGQTVHIWGPSTTAPGLSLVGLGANDVPAGTVPFTTSSLVVIGAAGTGGKYGAATTFAQLLGATGRDVPETSLVPVGQTTTFRTQAALLGSVVTITDTLSSVGGGAQVDSAAAFGTFEVVAWDNSSGLYSTWLQASSHWLAGEIAAGKGGAFTVSAIGGGLNTPPNLNNMQPMTSFNLYFIPEPSMFALAGLGAATLLIFRRRK